MLQEWFKTMNDMPAILRQAAEMGLFSSAALVRFLSMDMRPNVTRFVTRSLPPAVRSCVRWVDVGWIGLLLGAPRVLLVAGCVAGWLGGRLAGEG